MVVLGGFWAFSRLSWEGRCSKFTARNSTKNIFPESKTFRYLSSLGNRQMLQYYMACRQLLSRACMFLSVSIDGSRLSFRGMLLGVACTPEYTAVWLPPRPALRERLLWLVFFQVFWKTKNETKHIFMLAPLVGFLLHFGAT